MKLYKTGRVILHHTDFYYKQSDSSAVVGQNLRKRSDLAATYIMHKNTYLIITTPESGLQPN